VDEAVRFEGVVKRFGETVALAGVDLTLRSGQMVALLGPNGAGKTTAVSLMLGLRQATSGTVRVLGGDPGAAVRAGRVGAMLQTGGLPPGLRVSELVNFVRRLYPRPRPLRDLLEGAGCAPFADRLVERLSGGQAQRVRFAMAMAGDPELLFLDEPTTGFDVEARRRFWAEIRAFAGGGRTVLFATHYLEEADAVADRIVVVQRGRIVADGTGAALKAAAGGRVVRFEWLHAGDAGLRSLEGLPGVDTVDVDGARVRIRTADSDATVRALCAAGVPFRDMEIGGGDLESAFLALVGEAPAGEAVVR
jgi:ABC-2 type transport system ATP-binding protein